MVTAILYFIDFFVDAIDNFIHLHHDFSISNYKTYFLPPDFYPPVRISYLRFCLN